MVLSVDIKCSHTISDVNYFSHGTLMVLTHLVRLSIIDLQFTTSWIKKATWGIDPLLALYILLASILR
jgi:hypothetical protein